MKKKKGTKGVKGKKIRPAKQGWTQSTHQWNKDIFVCTGYSAKEIVGAIKKQKAVKWMVEFVEKEQTGWQKLIDANCAFVSAEEKHCAMVLRLRAFTDSWDFWETLIHEISHVVDMMAENQAFEKETEARAYLAEHLFHEIRRRLLGYR